MTAIVSNSSEKISVCFDGGGVRGVIPLVIMEKLCKIIGRTLPLWADSAAGSSVGAFTLSAMLVPDPKKPGHPLHSSEEILTNCIQKIPRIFTDTYWQRFRHYFTVKYERKELDLWLAEMLGKGKMNTLMIPFSTPIESFWRGKKILKDYHSKECALPLVQMIGGATACQTFFDPYEIEVDGETMSLRDGGIFANNPAMIANTKYQPDILLSFGTGFPDEEYLNSASSLRRRGVLSSLSMLVESSIGGPVRQTHQLLESSFEEGKYFRLDPLLSLEDYVTDDSSRLDSLIAVGETYCEEQEKQLIDIANLVLKKLGEDPAR